MNIQMSSALAQGDNTPVFLRGVDSNEVRITSVELVEMINTFRKEEGNEIEKQHNTLMRDIRMEIEALESVGIGQNNFVQSSYINKQNKEQPCYSLNKAGVLQMLNKESAVVRFKTTQYIDTLEQKLKGQQTLPQDLSPQLQFLINMELAQKQMKQQINQVNHHALEAKATAEKATKQMEAVRGTMLLDHDSWRKECTSLINKIAQGRGNDYSGAHREAYQLTEQRGRADLKRRVLNKQDRLRREGMSKSKVDAVKPIDVIAEDARLKEIYIAVVKEMAIKYGVA